MPEYHVTYETKAEVSIVIEAPDEDAAADTSWSRVNDVLNTLSTGYGTDGVKIETSIDGIGAASVTEVKG